MRLFIAAVILTTLPAFAFAQTPANPKPPDPDRQLVPAEPDFTLASLPTSLRLPRHAFGFRLTHRFTRAVGEGSVGTFFANFFEFDSSARIGLEVRYGMWSRAQAILHRTSEREMQLLLQHELVSEAAGRPFTVDAIVGVDGLNNFSQSLSGTLGAIVSRRIGDHGAIYAEPMVIYNSEIDRFSAPATDRTLMIGLGARLRFGKSKSYFVAETVPRLSGARPGSNHISVGYERRAGGHVFQFNVSNSLATTMRGLAHGGPPHSGWYVGFNLTRKFF